MGLNPFSKDYAAAVTWEYVKNEGKGGPNTLARAKVPGGWLLSATFPQDKTVQSVSFMADPNHDWASEE